MFMLVRKDIQANHWSIYVGSVFFLLLTYLITLPPTVVYFLTSFAIIFSAFSYDDKVEANRYLLSMPIVKEKIVKSRYFYSIVIMIGTLFIQLIMMIIMQFIFEAEFYMYSWYDIVTLIGIGLLMIAVFTPIMYYFSSITNAMFSIFFLVGLLTMVMMGELDKVLSFTDTIIFNDIDPGFSLIVGKYFPVPSYMIFIIFSGILLYGSMLLSVYFFKRKDQ